MLRPKYETKGSIFRATCRRRLFESQEMPPPHQQSWPYTCNAMHSNTPNLLINIYTPSSKWAQASNRDRGHERSNPITPELL
ncbi:hypothetical protein AOQ84DRAFT_104280 [Glonium stellatum]|uniref:Uncharacterized protein n=1 Tax=Glonium stellatum TaxID=574774 RepID=A0A8E2EUX6_9PEZI|nr:hypothetical protein AOQ84DRAFT_104280 [Glonium stellatum]